jgi:putative transposase
MSKLFKMLGIKQERTGYNNPYIERWFRTLKEETVWLQEYSSFLETKETLIAKYGLQ